MKTIITIIAIVILMIGAPNLFAISDYESGHRHGVADAIPDRAPDCADPKVSSL